MENKYLTLFDSHEDYEDADLIQPNVSYCKLEDEIHYSVDSAHLMWRTHEYDYEDEGETEHFSIPYLTDNGKLIVFDTNGYGLQVVQNVLMMPTDDYTALENAGLMPDWEIVYGTVVIPSSPLLQHFIVKDKTIIIDFAQDTISPTITEYYTEDN